MKNIIDEEEYALLEWYITKAMILMPLIILSLPFRYLYWKIKSKLKMEG